MSLVSQLHSGGLGHWCTHALPNTAPLIAEVQGAVCNVDPVRPAGDVDVDHWVVQLATFPSLVRGHLDVRKRKTPGLTFEGLSMGDA